MSQSPLPTKIEVEGRVRHWIDQRIWAMELHRAETGGFDFLENKEIELMGKNDASEIEALIDFAGNHLFDQRPVIASVLRGERDGAEFEPIIQSAARAIGETIDPSTVSGRVWARTILRGYATYLDEVREIVASIPKQVAAASQSVYPTFDFLMFWNEFETHKINNRVWKTDVAVNARGTPNIFRRICPSAGIKEICETALVSDFKTKFLMLNRDYSRGDWAKMEIDDLIAKVAELSAPNPRRPKDKLIKKVTPATSNKHFSNLSEYWVYLVEKKYVSAAIPNPFFGHHTAKKQGRAARDERNNWPPELDKKFFESPWIYGCKSIFRRSIPGEEKIRDGMFWVTLWGRLTGVRENEIADASVGDIKFAHTKKGKINYLEIAEDGKAAGSGRNVPVPKLLLFMGFLEYRVIGRDPSDPLFPDLIPQGPGLRRSAAFSGRFTTMRLNSGCYLERVDFHSYRGGVETALQNASGIKEAWIDELIGHVSDARKGEGARYTKEIYLPILQRCVEKIRIDVDLSHLEYRGPKGQPAPGRDEEIARYVAIAEREMNKKAARRIVRPVGA
jgi:hypothetical protein